MATFILVSGAWHAGWCWERVVPLLEAQGHVALAPDLVGMGPDRAQAARVGIADWADQIAALITAQTEPVILVGHSRGGVVISEAAERVPDRIARLVYLAAFLLPAGESIASVSTRLPRDHTPGGVIPAEDGTCTIRPEDVGPTFYNSTAPDWVERAASLIGPEPMASLATPLAVTAERFGKVPRAYVECALDHAVPIALQRLMQAEWPCDPVVTLETDHSPFYSAPDALADALGRIAR